MTIWHHLNSWVISFKAIARLAVHTRWHRCCVTFAQYSTHHVLIGVLIGLVMGASWFGFAKPAIAALPDAPSIPPISIAQLNLDDSTPSLPDSNFVTDTIDKSGSAVVQINVSRSLGGNVPDFLQPFFGGPPAQSPYRRMLQGVGSGFVISADGKVVTNAHVVSKADSVSVTFSDGRVLDGTVLGTDPITDIAVIQVEADDLPTVVLGDSDQVRQGQWAIAIGNPLGLQETVTVGVISATHRLSQQIGVPDKDVGFIQTDAAINPGNSGGPLLNQRGEVIGVNSAIIGGTQGLGFAVPINTAKEVAQQLIAGGKVDHPYIGVQMVALTPQIKQRANNAPGANLRVEADNGVLVIGVARGGPAAKAGIKEGDVVQAINRRVVDDAEAIKTEVKQAGIGGKLEMEILRQDRPMTVTVQTQQFPSQS
ncbi:MAG: trypsin-like peptidase domain-containing protein [Elainellaceae cyanobacterium]